MSLQDITTVLAVFVASICAYAFGVTYGMTNVVGLDMWPMIIPTGLFDASTFIIGISIYPIAALFLAYIYFELFKFAANRPRLLFPLTIAAIAISCLALPLLSSDYSVAFVDWILANTTAGILMAFILDRTSHFRLGIYVMFFFLVVVGKGGIDGERSIKSALASPDRYHVIADDRNYVNARVLRSTPSGFVIASGNEIMFYPIDRITRITRELTSDH